jgi:hypothetical protein
MNVLYTASVITDYRLSRRLVINVHSVFELSHRVDVSEVADVLKVHAASIFRVEVCRLVNF